MAKLSQKVKIALDETRMLILGAQVPVGFQFRAAFEDAFGTLPAESRTLAIIFVLATRRISSAFPLRLNSDDLTDIYYQ